VDNAFKPVIFEVGDKAEIQSGQFFGRIVEIVEVSEDEVAVRGNGWVVIKRYQKSQVRKLNLKGDHDESP
jgi:hypothetical protein